MQIRVYYEDTDCGNVVYYANYLRFMERSRTEFLRERGMDLLYWQNKGFTFVVVEVTGKYLASAQYNDLLDVESRITDLSPVVIHFHTTINHSSGSPIFEGSVRLACLSRNGRPTRIPKEIRNALTPSRNYCSPLA
jgi:acyl-CoA thioester hydrolase